VTVNQTQSQGLYRMPIEVDVQLPPGSQAAPGNPPTGRSQAPEIMKATIQLDKQENSLTIPLDTAPADVQLDPGLWVPLMQASFEAK
jgi:hypothetical protein